MADEEQFEGASSGASATYPKQCSALRKNEFVVIKQRACKIVEMSTSKTGKHGHAKVHLVGIDVFSGKKYEDICPSTHNMEVPVVTRSEYTAISKDDDGYLELMDDCGQCRSDLKLPADEAIVKEIDSKLKSSDPIMVTVLKAMGEEVIVGTKQDRSGDK